MDGKAKFATKIGLVAATVGSAIGLGNVWRFPAETQGNGGAAFLLVYIVCVLVLGMFDGVHRGHQALSFR